MLLKEEFLCKKEKIKKLKIENMEKSEGLATKIHVHDEFIVVALEFHCSRDGS